jgi:asparagine synthase (glutamine-hydrolysing)
VADQASEDAFWDLRYGTGGSPVSAGLPQEIFGRIRTAVRGALAGAAPDDAGAFLSGGTDSTTVAAFAAEALEHDLDVFSIVFEDPSHSEERFMSAAARRFPLRRHSFELDEAAFMKALGPVRLAYDEPYANASVYAAYYCFVMAEEAGKKFLLAGDGGDEIFGGNERYLKDSLLGRYASIPGALKLIWEAPLDRLPIRGHLANRLRKMFRRSRLPNPDRFYADTEFASAHWERLRGPAFRTHPVEGESSLDLVRDLYRQCTATEELDRLLYLDMKLAIADNDLRKVVGCGAIFGIEPRFPFLNLDLVEFANALPASQKLRGLQKRYGFKQAMRGYVPDEILFKRKQGMGLPLGQWLREAGPVSAYARERLADRSAADLFDRRYLDRIWEQHQRGEWDHAEDLWRIVVLVDWFTTHLEGE